jgi:hypothetical protein
MVYDSSPLVTWRPDEEYKLLFIFMTFNNYIRFELFGSNVWWSGTYSNPTSPASSCYSLSLSH